MISCNKFCVHTPHSNVRTCTHAYVDKLWSHIQFMAITGICIKIWPTPFFFTPPQLHRSGFFANEVVSYGRKIKVMHYSIRRRLEKIYLAVERPYCHIKIPWTNKTRKSQTEPTLISCVVCLNGRNYKRSA